MLSPCLHCISTNNYTAHTTEESYLHDQNHENIKCHICYCVHRSMDNTVPILTPYFFNTFLNIILSHTHLGLPRALPSSFYEEYMCILYLHHVCNMSTTCHAHHAEKHGSGDVRELTVPCLTHSMHTVLRSMDNGVVSTLTVPCSVFRIEANFERTL
jgi:hypothetical protein